MRHFDVFVTGPKKSGKSSLIRRHIFGDFNSKYIEGNEPSRRMTITTSQLGDFSLRIKECSLNELEDKLKKVKYQHSGILYVVNPLLTSNVFLDIYELYRKYPDSVLMVAFSFGESDVNCHNKIISYLPNLEVHSFSSKHNIGCNELFVAISIQLLLKDLN